MKLFFVLQLFNFYFFFFLAIRSSWATLTNEIESIGVLTFLHMFERHPNMKNNFKSFKHLTHQELQTSEIFHNHAARVVNVVKKVSHLQEFSRGIG
jgi:hypothetical protein